MPYIPTESVGNNYKTGKIMIDLSIKREILQKLAQAHKAQIETEQLFYNVAKNTVGDVKETATQAAILIKKGHSVAVAGMEVGLFTALESRAIHKAIEEGRLSSALLSFSNYYEIRSKALTHFKHLAPYGFVLLLAILIAPLPDLVLGSTSSIYYVLSTALPLSFIITLFWVLEHPRKAFRSRLSVAFSVPQKIIKLPAVGPRHIRSEITTFLEYCGILHLCGYAWKDAVGEAATQVVNPVIRSSLSIVPTRIQRRDPFVDAVIQCEYFPEEYIDVLRASEKANRLDDALIRFKASDLLKGQARIKKECERPARLLLIGAGFLFAYGALRFWMLSRGYS